MSKKLAKVIDWVARASTLAQKRRRRASTLALASERLVQRVEAPITGGVMVFECQSARALHDPEGFGVDEPETVRWIDEHVSAGDIFWDIGANIGLYALYAALEKKATVLAFEPSAASFANLVRNIEINGVDENVSAYCLAFDDHTRLERLNMASTRAGHSMHAFGQLETVEGAVTPAFRQSVMGYSIDDWRRIFAMPAPAHIKLDVDSIELQILRGARETLPEVKTVLVELETQSDTGKSITELLDTEGFQRMDAGRWGKPRNQMFVNTRFV
jgi:FkbM family methyltransferase